MTPWSHLPNAKHIDRVVAHQKAYPEVWKHSLEIARRSSTTLGSTPRHVAFDVVMEKANSIDGRYEVVDAWWHTEYANHARGALLALIAYDDAGKYLSFSVEKLKMIIRLSEHPAAILLLLAVIAFEETKKVDNKPKS
jgi:hypothetical protein